jgi:hypothetical protein
MGYMHHRNSRQHKLPDSTAVAENRIAGGVGEGTGAIPFPRPDPPSLIKAGCLYLLKAEMPLVDKAGCKGDRPCVRTSFVGYLQQMVMQI